MAANGRHRTGTDSVAAERGSKPAGLHLTSAEVTALLVLSGWRYGRPAARIAADIPCFLMSSGRLEMGPGGGLVVGGSGFEAAVEDADEAVAELA